MQKYLYEPTILDDFTCLADQCPDTCCTGAWNIRIDEATIARWKALPDVEVTSDLLASTESYEDDGKTVLRFKKNEAGDCCHMNESGYCSIYSHDENGLRPEVCRIYPRNYADVGFMKVNTLSLSCPEVARLVFASSSSRALNASKLLRRWLQQGQDREGNFSSPEACMQRMLSLLWEKKQYSYSVRLAFLARLLVYIVESANEVSINAAFFEDIYANMGSLLREFAKEVEAAEIASDAKQSAQIWRSCFSLLREKMPELVPESSRFVALAESDDQEGFYDLIKEIKKEHKTLWDDFSPLFDRYLEISFMNKNFPSKPYWGNYAASFLNVVIPFYCIEMGLYVLLEQAGHITEQDLVNMTYRVERGVQDNLIYGQLTKKPEMLRIDQYYTSLLEL